MKRFGLFFLVIFTVWMQVSGQTPESFQYQAVVRNTAGEILSNQNVGLRIALHETTAQGPVVYQETHQATTNAFGLINLSIGSGAVVSGSFDALKWHASSFFLEIFLDPNGGSNYVPMGTSLILSAPYSLLSKKSSGPVSMTSQERDAITTPWPGMMIMNRDTRKMNYFDGYGWIEINGIRQADFTCGQPLLDDRDGSYYNTVELAGKCWMARNLNYGQMIQGIANQTDNNIAERYCYQNNPSLCETYGGLYQWREMMMYTTTEGAQGICPKNWHIPSDSEWTDLINATGGTNNAGTYLVQGGGSGFEALMGGQRNLNTGYPFANVGTRAYFWTSTQTNSNISYDRYLQNGTAQVYTEQTDKNFGLSVRCVKD
ncbi:MAG: hypothetical protein JXA03_14265 [Bacteroidales bacterium]|nr:hypothetical protein [Bacteroidales bacterium]